MSRALLLLTVFLCSIVSFAQEKRSTFIKDQPVPMQVVNDFGKFLTKVENVHLERELRSFRERTGYSVVIITIPGLTDNKGTKFTIEETAQLYFNKWGIGDNVKNDGVLIMLSMKPRRIRIHTGSGMATLLTNANCASIINHTMVPSFKADLYFTGLKDAVKDIEMYIADNEAANSTDETATPIPQGVTSRGVILPQEGMTFGKFMYAFITIVTLVWLYFRYRLKKAALGRSGVYSGGGYDSDVVVNNVNRISNNNWGSGWGGSGRKNSWFNSGGSGSSSWFGGGSGSSGSSSSSRSSGSSKDDSSNSSSSGGASGSYGGGSSSGGGASGSW